MKKAFAMLTVLSVMASMPAGALFTAIPAMAAEAAEENTDETMKIFSSYAGVWEEKKEDGTEGYRVSIAEAGAENTFDVFIESAEEDHQRELFVAQATFGKDQALAFSNGAYAVRTFRDDGTTTDELKGTNEEGTLRYDPEEDALVWTYFGDNIEKDGVIEDQNEVYVLKKVPEEKPEEAEPEEKPAEAEPEEKVLIEQEEPEILTYVGTAAEVIRNVVFVKEANGNAHMCLYNHQTEFDFGRDGILGVDDDIRIDYQENGDQHLATKLTVTNHKIKIYWMQGTIVDMTNSTITVSSNALTVTFKKDGNTAVSRGNFTKGSIVNIGYIGDLSESPYAVSIAMVRENREPQKFTAYGIISDFGDNYVLLSINSSHAYVFNRNANTTVTGVTGAMGIGDSVVITYTGSLGQSPNALDVNIIQKAAPDKNTIAGDIVFIDPNTVTIAAGDNQYIIRTDAATVYTGDPMNVGIKAVITYTGAMDKDPLAVSIYCVAQEPAPTPEPTVTPEPTEAPAPEPTEAPAPEPTEAPAPEPTEAPAPEPEPTEAPAPEPTEAPVPEPTEEPEPDQADLKIEKSGTILEWKDKNSCKIRFDDGETVTLRITDETKISSGYFPQKDDVVKVIFRADGTLMDVQLLQRPAPAPEPEPEPQPVPEPQPIEEPQPVPEPQPIPEPQPEPELFQATEPIPEPEAAPEPEPVLQEAPAETAE